MKNYRPLNQKWLLTRLAVYLQDYHLIKDLPDSLRESLGKLVLKEGR